MDSPKPAGRYRRRPDPLPRESSSSSLDGHSPAELLLITEQDNCSRGKEELLHCETFLPRDFVNIRPLGSGSGGTVFLVRHLATNTVMARKVVHLEIKPAIRQQIVLELRVLHNCRSPQIVGFYGSFCHDGEIHILTEYMDCGSLDMVQARVGRIEENMLRHICFQVLLGLDYLQTNLKVMHRDVKPSNILLNSKGEVKVCDFGICAELTSSIAFSFVGTRFYMAPERLLGKEYAVSSDVWSLGLSLIELATGHFPIPADGIENLVVLRSPSAPLPTDERKSNMSVFELLGHIVEGEAPRLPAAFSNEFRDFVAKCLVKDPSARPSMANLLEHPWITAAASQPIDMAEWAKGTLPFGRDESLRPRPASQAPFDSLI